MKPINHKRKICVVTGTRAEYGLLYLLMKAIKESPNLELQIIATAMHLSPEFGSTYREIEKDGFTIDKKVESLLSSDTTVGISKSMGLTIIGMADALAELKPDMMVLLGDRFEIFAAAAAGTVARIPIAHIAGGESTEGAIDEAFRHSITKMSHLHFAATELYKRRIIQLGENPEHVYNVGALGIDNIKYLPLLNRKEFEESINFKLGKKNLLITFHPETLGKSSSETQFKELLYALDMLDDTKFIFTRPNADADSRAIIELLKDYVGKNKDKASEHISLGQTRYLSALQHVDAVVGNSSSGIVEMPYFKKATINIGDRQKGRIMGPSVINCEPERMAIYYAIEYGCGDEFKTKKNLEDNPYGNGVAVAKIMGVINNQNLDNILKKTFYNLPVNE